MGKISDLYGLGNINIELCSRCNKNCWMCGRRNIDKDPLAPKIQYGDIDFNLLKKISEQLPPNIMVQFHKDGEGLLYPLFGEAVALFGKQITNIVTNGKLLVEKSGEIIDNLDTLSVSIFENDPEAQEQYVIIEEFLKIKGDKKPFTSLRLIGDVDPKPYEKFGALIIHRILHHPLGSFKYQKKNPTIPETGICRDFLNHLCINREGKVSICVRFDPTELGVIGNANTQTLNSIWNSEKRMKWLEFHKKGQRNQIPLCQKCEYWGVPTS